MQNHGEIKIGLRELHERLLAGKTWRYLRYLHAREAILKIHNEINTVLVVGCGGGVAEVALAIEFPLLNFHLTDYGDASHSTALSKSTIKKFNLSNITFGELDILNIKEIEARYDLVYSVEVLEHIKEAQYAAENMTILARKYIFCLVPFAEKSLNLNARKREAVLKSHGHHFVGFDQDDLIQKFKNCIEIRWCYWKDAGFALRERLTLMTIAEIRSEFSSLQELAQLDLKQEVPMNSGQAQGIWILASVCKENG